MSCSFVSDELRSSYDDLVFRTRCGTDEAFVYLLIEQRNCSDRLMPLRMLDSIIGVWNHYRDQNPEVRTLPVVFPVVVRNDLHGSAWAAPTELAELYDVSPAMLETLGPLLPRFKCLLDDVATIYLAALQAPQPISAEGDRDPSILRN